MKALKRGDLIRHKHSPYAYVVCANYGDRLTAIRSVDVSNPVEWEQVDNSGRAIST